MIRFFLVLVFLFLFYFILKFVRMMLKYTSSTKSTINDLKHKAENLKQKYGDIEEAEFREIPPEEEDKEKP